LLTFHELLTWLTRLNSTKLDLDLQVPIRWLPQNLEPALVVQHASLISELALRANKAIQDLDIMNDWTFLRVRSHKHEIMVCPEKEFMMIVVQDPNKKDAKVDENKVAS